MSAPAPFRVLLRVLPVVLLLLAAASVRADPPGRVARVNHVEGSVSLAPAGDDEWTEAPRNRPLTRGDRLWTDRGSRAELQVGSSALRLDGRTRLDILALDDRSTQLSLTQGTLYVRVRSIPEGENFEVDTPNLAWRAAWPGDYRIDVDPGEGTTRVTIHSGTGAVYGESGQALPLGGGQQITFRGRELAQLAAQESPPLDGFDRWAQARNRREDQSIAARYVPREVVGYQDLDPHGQWRRDPVHGAVWLPQAMPADWAPYRHGHWDWIGPWGWTWIDDAPWGFAPFHYGRWTLLDEQWAWVPGRLGVRPVYAPALVAFLGGGTGSVTWFPLAPGEAWRPPYRTSPAYLGAVNRDLALEANPVHAHQRSPQALTSVAVSDFHRGRPAGAGWLRIAANVLMNAQVVAPPAMPDRTALAQARANRVPVTAPASVRQVVADAARPEATTRSASPAPALRAQAATQPPVRAAAPAASDPAPAAAASTRAATPQPARVPKAVAVAREAARSEAVAVRREPGAVRGSRGAAAPPPVRAQAPLPARPVAAEARQAAQAAAARQRAVRQLEAKRAVAARTEEARRDKLRAADLVRREATARRAEQLQRQEQLRREAVARRAEHARRQAHAQQVEQARQAAERDARALAEQRVRREQQARRAEQEREQAERAAWQRAQQATTEQWRREHDAWEQRQRPRGRPDLRSDPRYEPAYRTPEVWQRGIPLLAPGRTS
ncbi:chromosome partitioning protein ParA [Ramlibacter sp. RBP-2]|uniref:Chromosome partitioning protein ParA n=1 Tax=Ramlibacter lithotrophicus TaxID=2606681 RepID=A0A7X6I7Q1_9BURK|nr:FecR family protein [Ramlibacter lithotrophicus]NKE67751.1 chromosome partitioning protein ParA [Ramlibacter lithotrophicus]